MLRALARWPGRRIAVIGAVSLVWLIGLVVPRPSAPGPRGDVFVGIDVTGDAAPPDSARTGRRFDSLQVFLFAVMRDSALRHAVMTGDRAVRTRIKDSVARLPKPATLTAAQQESLYTIMAAEVKPLANAAVPILEALARVRVVPSWGLVLLVSVLLLPPLGGLTLVPLWLIARRRFPPKSGVT